MGFIVRPPKEVRRHTYENVRQNGSFTINMVHPAFVRQAHYTSARFDADESEFEACRFTEEYIEGFSAPFVQESRLKIGLQYLSEIPILINGTMLIIGQVEHIIMPDDVLVEDNQIDLEKLEAVGIGGLNTYYSVGKIGYYPYARKEEFTGPDQEK
jgi:flavin reductase (DIM6/NTAB) family NADH-FMN oxidoreductase RutF